MRRTSPPGSWPARSASPSTPPSPNSPFPTARNRSRPPACGRHPRLTTALPYGDVCRDLPWQIRAWIPDPVIDANPVNGPDPVTGADLVSHIRPRPMRTRADLPRQSPTGSRIINPRHRSASFTGCRGEGRIPLHTLAARLFHCFQEDAGGLGAGDGVLLVDDEEGNAGDALGLGRFRPPGDLIQERLVVQLAYVDRQALADLEQRLLLAYVAAVHEVRLVDGVEDPPLLRHRRREVERVRAERVRHPLDRVPVERQARLQADVGDTPEHRLDVVIALDRPHVLAEIPPSLGHLRPQEIRVDPHLGLAVEVLERVIQVLLADPAPRANRVLNDINGDWQLRSSI